ncbi:hypothetical protein A176_002576 [Myxococcus hansupus]|uniref:Uncharacterized protein n=1 Tax=Pseudomyxococcus hansupus TaxID=1297742 RepID=A0A0H4WS75_9BACT|nr:hypothetical protein A176_002576 [Myxococcus hansupus]
MSRRRVWARHVGVAAPLCAYALRGVNRSGPAFRSPESGKITGSYGNAVCQLRQTRCVIHVRVVNRVDGWKSNENGTDELMRSRESIGAPHQFCLPDMRPHGTPRPPLAPT